VAPGTASSAAPLDLREVFALPWEGEARVETAWWARWFPVPRSFRFRTEIVVLHGDAWDVLDTTTLPDGTTQARRMRARLVAADRVRVEADDMPDGAEITTRCDGFDFAPYVLRTPVLGPLRVPLRYSDRVDLTSPGTLVDRIELRFLGARIAIVTMQLHRLDGLDSDAPTPNIGAWGSPS
jgi:hypothetical protein